jgi:sporulation protein YlmC with PRC-barrel domain
MHDTKRNAKIGAVIPGHEKAALPAFVGVTLITLVTLFFMTANTRPALSQGVQLVKVDVAVVAKGYRASKLIGSSVTNEKNEKIGTLDDIIIGRDRVMFAILQVGGFLGIGSRLVAVPYESLQIDSAGKKIELPGASKDQLNKLTEFKYAT